MILDGQKTKKKNAAFFFTLEKLQVNSPDALKILSKFNFKPLQFHENLY